ncbi:hypothetical protein CDV36_012223 [Fusarium kuroshium]|uniref:Peptidase C14 caspase domain-containing protein n=1 Tax=Fusarium kuroshium TaxID=2010991 RepID=A0A3M2RSB5_9HYPO|nr:hypothetical protein CDV36_012223 [Fusarium kuroshium]
MSIDLATTTHYALLIGIAYYREKPLKGCVNDVRELEKLLQKHRQNIDIKTLTATPTTPVSCHPAEDESSLPTHDNVLSSLNSIISRASSGDFVYVHFSGHGTTVEPKSNGDRKPDASTGDLALVLFDKGPDGIRYLRGQELSISLKQAVDKGLKLTLVLDCCFSGSVVRNDDSVRGLPYDVEVDRRYPPFQWTNTFTGDDAALYPTKRGASMRTNWVINPSGYTVFAACGPSEESEELSTGAGHHGALTYFLLRAFDRIGRVGGRLYHLYAHLCARFRERLPDQKPMLYGNKRLGFFEDLTAELYAAPIPIIQDDSLLLLEAGEAHGVCEGDRFALCSVDTGQSEDTTRQKEIFEVKNAGPLSSELSPVSPRSGSYPSGMAATALTHLSLQKYPVRLQLPSQNGHTWTKALQERQSLNVATGDAISGDLFTFHVAVISKEAYEIRDASNKLLANLPPPILDLEEDPSFVLDIIEHLARYEMIKDLFNKSPSQNFIESFQVELRDETTGRTFLPGCQHNGPLGPTCSHAECVVEITENAKLYLTVRNEGGNGDTLFLHVYNLDVFWEVENMLKGDHDVLPPPQTNKNRYFSSGTDGAWRKEMVMTIPDELKNRGETECEDIIKVFLTRQPTSFMSLELPPIGDICGRRTPKSSRGGSQRYESDDWAVLNFRIRTLTT